MHIVARGFVATIDFNLPAPSAASRFTELLLKDVFLILGVGIALFLALAIGIKLSRKKRRRVREGSKVYRPSSGSRTSEEDAIAADAGTVAERRRYKRRQQRRNHRARNPSLAETGGLPPARNNSQSDGHVNG
jgi:hypothetical protein